MINAKNRPAKWRLFVILIVLIYSLWFCYPNFLWLYKLTHGEKISQSLIDKKVPLGLDLKGGVHLVLKIDIDKALIDEISGIAREIKRVLKEEGINVKTKVTKETITIINEDPTAGAKIKKIILNKFKDRFFEPANVDYTKKEITLRVNPHLLQYYFSDAINKSLLVIKNRVDAMGLTQPSISRAGKDRIIVQLPGEENPERAIKNILKPANLEFRLVAPSKIQKMAINENGTLKKDYVLPEEYEVLFEKRKTETGETLKIPLVVEKYPVFTGKYLEKAYIGRDTSRFNQIYVGLIFNFKGAKIFEEVTGSNIGKRLAIVLDGVIYSAPVIQTKIAGGRAQITGNFTYQEAKDLADVLNAGALPVPLKVVENRTVGPTLGKDFIEKGLKATLYGFIAVIIFMILYYGFAGIVADLALLFNLLIILAVMTSLRATMTLPGIAGVILTVGMAVDANVIIYERIKEELKKGKTIRAAVEDGYARGFLTIFDSNLTTIFAALVLLEFGKGPIKGFAVTLTFGILASMFTALFCTRYIFDLILSSGKVKSINFGWGHLFEKTNIPFIKLRKAAFILSGTLILMSFVTFGTKGINWGIDFSGGTSLQIRFSGDVKTEQIRKSLKEAGYESFRVQELKSTNLKPGEKDFFIKVKTLKSDMNQIKENIKKILNEKIKVKYKILKVDSVGSEVGHDFRMIAWSCFIFASIAIIIYLWYRFELDFGVAAVIALIHDLIITSGIITMMGKDVTLTTIAALLTIMGYSVNDTIVIFDRIRENLHLKSTLGFAKLIDKAINDSMSRTVMTSFTTLLVVIIMYLFGGGGIKDEFALPLLIGIIVGTYSSSFVAAPIVYEWQTRKKI